MPFEHSGALISSKLWGESGRRIMSSKTRMDENGETLSLTTLKQSKSEELEKKRGKGKGKK